LPIRIGRAAGSTSETRRSGSCAGTEAQVGLGEDPLGGLELALELVGQHPCPDQQPVDATRHARLARVEVRPQP
jgi:hypothetical protein